MTPSVRALPRSAIRLARALVPLLVAACQPTELRVRVACVGDSITEGRDVEEPAARYPARLAGLLGPRFDVRNFGVGGATMLSSGDRPYVRQGAYRESLAFRPDVVVIALGSNDAKPANWAGRASFLADARALVASFREANPKARVFLCLPPPVLEPGAFGIRPAVVANEVVPLLVEAARETGAEVIDLRAPFSGRPELLPDTVHPSAEGAAAIAEAVRRTVAGTVPVLPRG